jgi:hypothetical protein
MPNTDDCNNDGVIYNGVLTPCSTGQLVVQHDYVLGGIPGANYQVTMHFYGIVEGKNYGSGVTREAAPSSHPGNQNSGAMPTPWAVANQPTSYTVMSSTYNTYEIHVYNHLGTLASNRVGMYFVNADTTELHITYVLNFEKTIPVIGGGRIRMRTHDMNCRLIKNCGSVPGFPCANKARTVNISAASPQPLIGAPPSGFTQPGLGQSNDHAGQWLLVDVTAVAGPF